MKPHSVIIYKDMAISEQEKPPFIAYAFRGRPVGFGTWEKFSGSSEQSLGTQLARWSQTTEALANRHPKITTSLALVLMVGAIGLIPVCVPASQEADRVLDRIALRSVIGDAVVVPQIPSAENNLIVEQLPFAAENLSGWNTFTGKGFSLKYPKESGWGEYPGGIFFSNPGQSIEDLRIDTWVKSIGRGSGSFEAYVSQQYNTLTSKAMASQPAKMPSWEQAGLKAEVLTYESKPWPNAPQYNTRSFMAYINGMVYHIVVSEKKSEIGRYDLVVDRILNSLAIAGVPRLATK